MMKNAWVYSLLLLALSSCSTSPNKRPNEAFFTNTDDPDLPYMTRNGENYGREGVGYSYEEVTREATVDSVAKEIDSGKSVFLFLHLDSCSHCAAAHDDYVNAWLDSGLEVFSLKFIQKSPQAAWSVLHGLADRYPAYANTFNGEIYTPSCYLLDSKDKIRPVAMENQRESLQNLEEFLNELMNFTCVYTFRTFDSYLSFAKDYDCLAYRKDEGDSFFSGEVFPLAKHSKKHTAELQYQYFSAEDQRRCDAYFGAGNDMASVSNGTPSNLIDIEKSPDQAGQFVKSYYNG